MAFKQQTKVSRKIICRKGYCTCQNRKYVHDKGIMDVFNYVKNLATPAMNLIKNNTDTVKSTAEAIGNFVKIGDSTNSARDYEEKKT